MMSYFSPCLKDLFALADESEQYSGTNPKRLSFIALYDQLANQTSQITDLPENIMNVLIGGLVFEMADIKFGEYRGASPKKREGWIFSSGSDRYTFIKKKLLISKANQFGYDERLFYLNEFYKYIDKLYPAGDIRELEQNKKLKEKNKNLIWKEKEDLLIHIRITIASIFKRNSEDFYNLVHGVPVLNALLKNLQKLEVEYSASSYHSKNPKRLEILNFIKFILKSYENSNPMEGSWHVCAAVLLVSLRKIEPEYKFLSPTRSRLFRQCLCALNQESIHQISLDDRIKWLRLLSSHVITICENKDRYLAILNRVVESTKDQKLNSEILDRQIKGFQQWIEQELAALDKQKNTPSNMKYVISVGTGYAVQYVAAPVMLQAAKNLVIGGLGMGGFFVGGLAGSAVFSTAGTLLMSGLGRLVAEGVMNTVSANLFAWVLGKIGNGIGNVTADVITCSFSATPKGLEEMRKTLKPEDDVAFVRMVNTMLELDMVSETDKEHIRNLLGLEKGNKLQPLKTSILQTEEEKLKQNAILIEGHAVKILT
ncbi:MAG: hypothetical protein KIT56_04105 [Gammaproteobacteria bacterium]|nr:hypothetical protein [Gammaproteobacteria bacterium]MCW5583060.1 hypothetical protein [Gammaproteobacteria bacterium]